MPRTAARKLVSSEGAAAVATGEEVLDVVVLAELDEPVGDAELTVAELLAGLLGVLETGGCVQFAPFLQVLDDSVDEMGGSEEQAETDIDRDVGGKEVDNPGVEEVEEDRGAEEVDVGRAGSGIGTWSGHVIKAPGTVYDSKVGGITRPGLVITQTQK